MQSKELEARLERIEAASGAAGHQGVVLFDNDADADARAALVARHIAEGKCSATHGVLVLPVDIGDVATWEQMAREQQRRLTQGPADCASVAKGNSGGSSIGGARD